MNFTAGHPLVRAPGARSSRAPTNACRRLASVWKPTPTLLSVKPDPEPDDNKPGVPGFRSWRGVYVFVFLCFVAVVAALTVFTHHFG
jgi:hypothetical protein